MNRLQKIMKTKLGMPEDSKGLITPSQVKTAAKWLSKHKQTNNGKSYESIN